MMVLSIPRIDNLFIETKLVCFGRYTLRVPLEAQLNWGKQTINDGFITYPNAANQVKEILTQHWDMVRSKDSTAEIIAVKNGPIQGGSYFWYYHSDLFKKEDTRNFFGATVANGHAFMYQGGGVKGEAESEFANNLETIHNLHYRDADEIPTDPGVCIEHGFVKENTYRFQEHFAVGIYLPSLPDVSFSVGSNKDATGVGDGLLKGIQEQRIILGNLYPELDNLREGKKTIRSWVGEESLVRRKDGTHEFDWEAISGERSVAHPGVIEAKLYSKVEQNRIGAATQASVSDAEAIALWDKLLRSLSYRVEVPSGPVQK